MFFGSEAEPLKESLNEEDRRKRSRAAVEQASLEIFLKDLGEEEASVAGGDDGGRPHAEDKGKRSAAPVDAVAAAKTKAGRERARRERLNERWARCLLPLSSVWLISIFLRACFIVCLHTPHVFPFKCGGWGTPLGSVMECQAFVWER